MKAVAALGQGLLELLYPRRCFLCERPLAPGEGFNCICDGCLGNLAPLGPPICERCGAPLADEELDLCLECANRERAFDLARSYGLYEGSLAELIQGLKYERERALARPLARLLLQAEEPILSRAEVLTFVPMTRDGLRKRGFNQAQLLARELGRLTGLPVIAALRKTRRTADQTQLKLPERRENVRGAFAARRPAPAEAERIALIDDVYTTGATAEECSAALREAGYKEVYVLTVARSRLGPSGPGPRPRSEEGQR